MSLHHMLRAAAGYQAPAPATTDPQFNYVSLLLHGDGTNGAQNNTFLDSSTNNFTITRNGNTTQGSLSPYGNLWSNFFDGAGDYLTFPAGAATAFGTNNFTIEAWVYPTTSGTFRYLFDNRNSGQTTNWAFYLTSGNQIEWFTGSAGITGSGGTITANTWNHVAYTRSGTTGRLFLNGAQVGSGTDSTNYSVSSTISYIASRYSATEQFSGSFSNLRIVNGTAVYTSAFTPPTAPLTAISGTSLLTCQSNRFRDNSANNFTITRNGDVRVTKEAPFLPTAAYSTSTIGGSGYFDGSTDWLEITSNTALQLGSSDFCVECWINPTALPAGGNVARFISKNSGYTSLFEYTLMLKDDGSIQADAYTTGYFSMQSAAGLVKANSSWYHVAYSKAGTTAALFVNGVRVATGTLSGTIQSTAAPLAIGRDLETSGREFTGFISDARIVKGSSVYTPSSTTLTVPTAPLTAITNTSLLLNFTNAGIFDNAAENNLETVGNAQISTSVKKYGTGSIAFDGNGDYLAPNDALPYTFGSGDFTVEFWLYLNSTQTAILYDGRPVSGVGATPTIYVASNVLYYFTNNANRITGSTLSNTTWTHVALCKSGGSTRLFVNGTQVGSTYTDSVTYTNTVGRPLIGASGETVGQFPLNGYIDDLRITKGYARYTANFTPPTAAFPDQ
jgi:hypothetical protein